MKKDIHLPCLLMMVLDLSPLVFLSSLALKIARGDVEGKSAPGIANKETQCYPRSEVFR